MSINDITFRALSQTKHCSFCEGTIAWEGFHGSDVDTSNDNYGCWTLRRQSVPIRPSRNKKSKKKKYSHSIWLNDRNELDITVNEIDEYDEPYNPGETFLVHINFCPFCGKPIKHNK